MAVTMSMMIVRAVGAPPAPNDLADVKVVQTLLNQHAAAMGFSPFNVTGVSTPQLIDAIKIFQKKAVGMNLPDGRVDPNGKTIAKLNQPVGVTLPAAAQKASTPDEVFPRLASSPFGWRAFNMNHMHAGIDFAMAIGTALGAMCDGQARFQKHAAAVGWGYHVELLVGGVIKYRYAHLDGTKTQALYNGIGASSIKEVKKGDLIAYSGMSGTSAAHLHFEYLESGNRVSPCKAFSYGGSNPDTPVLATGATLVTTKEDAVSIKLSVKAPDWDLAKVEIKLVQLNGKPVAAGTHTYELTVDGTAPNRAIHAGSAKWSIERSISGLPKSDDPKETTWTFEVTATTWKNKTSSANFTYKFTKPKK